MDSLITILTQIISGVAGGNIAGAIKQLSLGTAGNSIAGGLGGLLLGQLGSYFTSSPALASQSDLLQNTLTSGTSGIIITAVIALIRNLLNKSKTS